MKVNKKIVNIILILLSSFVALLQFLMVYKVKEPAEFNKFNTLLKSDTSFLLLMIFLAVLFIAFTSILYMFFAWIYRLIVGRLIKINDTHSAVNLSMAFYLFILLNAMAPTVIIFNWNRLFVSIFNPFTIVGVILMFVMLTTFRYASIFKISLIVFGFYTIVVLLPVLIQIIR
ncbi:MAG: hypothetical protein ABF754_03710 [Leuconostoc pseudomesenteroides]